MVFGNILIIENDPHLVRMYPRALRGHNCTIVRSGQEAISKVMGEELSFDMIISDGQLDGPLAGEDVYECICDHLPSYADKYLFVSSSSSAQEFCAVKNIPLLEKPASAADIRKIIESVLTRTRSSNPE